MVMAGYFYAAGGARTAGFIQEVLDLQAITPAEHDQQVFNTVLSQPKPAKQVLQVRILSPRLCVNGMNFFTARAVTRQHLPFVIQNNWATGASTKQYRFEEFGLWYLSPAAHPTKPKRYLSYTNIHWPLPLLLREKSALRAALAIAQLLDRVLVLPLFCQVHTELAGTAPQRDRWCTADELFDISELFSHFGRESFVPNALLSS